MNSHVWTTLSRTEKKFRASVLFMQTTVNTTVGTSENMPGQNRSTYPPGYAPIDSLGDEKHSGSLTSHGEVSSDDHTIGQHKPVDIIEEFQRIEDTPHSQPGIPNDDVFQTSVSDTVLDIAMNPIQSPQEENQPGHPKETYSEALVQEGAIDPDESVDIPDNSLSIEHSGDPEHEILDAEFIETLVTDIQSGGSAEAPNEEIVTNFPGPSEENQPSDTEQPVNEPFVGEQLEDNSTYSVNEVGSDDSFPLDFGMVEEASVIKAEYGNMQLPDEYASVQDSYMDPMNWLVPPLIIILTSVIFLFRSKNRSRACCCKEHFKDRPATVLSGSVTGQTGSSGTSRDSILRVLQKLHDDLLGIRADQQIVDREYLETSSQVLDAIRTQIACTSPGPDEPLRSPSPPTARRIHFPTLTNTTDL